jgi:hypothetical protein
MTPSTERDKNAQWTGTPEHREAKERGGGEMLKRYWRQLCDILYEDISAAHLSGHTVLFTGEKCICCAIVVAGHKGRQQRRRRRDGLVRCACAL